MWQPCSVSGKVYISAQLISNILKHKVIHSIIPTGIWSGRVKEPKSKTCKNVQPFAASPNASCSFQCPASLFSIPTHIGSERKRMRMAQQTFVSSDLGLSLHDKTAQESFYLVHPTQTVLNGLVYLPCHEREVRNKLDLVDSSQQ